MDKQKGLGDTVAAITKATGIEMLVKSIFGENCGCAERQEALNKLVPYQKEKKKDRKSVV
jgi:aspartyl/asparaginyl-tRNA synthetase